MFAAFALIALSIRDLFRFVHIPEMTPSGNAALRDFLYYGSPAITFLISVFFFLLAYLRLDSEPDDSNRVGTDTFGPQQQQVRITIHDPAGPISGTMVGGFAVPIEPGDEREPRPSALGPTGDADIASLFGDIQRRLRREITALGTRGNLNLVFGVIITLFGLGVLWYLVIRQHPDIYTMPSVLAHYLPRLSTVALVEAFAYFFLGLYKSNLEEIKYYQNERTTATVLEIAWRASLGEEKNKTAAFVIRQLAQTDRNAAVPVTSKGGKAAKIDIMSLMKAVTKMATDAEGKGEKE